MASTTWTFGTEGSGLYFVVTIDDSGAASVHMIEGSMDLNALWFSDGDSLKEGDTSLINSLSSLKMTGSGSVDADGNTITWDEMTALSKVGLGSAGTAKITFLTAGETQSITLDAGSLAFLESQESLADIILGIRATSVNGTGGIKLNAEADPFVDTTAPTFFQQSSYSFNYNEKQSANAVVAEITTATDDVAVTQYRFVSAEGQPIGTTTTDGYFSIDDSGTIRITTAGSVGEGENFPLANIFGVGADQHIYYVQAGDAQGNWSSAQQITLNELDYSAPKWNNGQLSSYNFNYNENQSADAVVAQLGIELYGDNAGVTQFRFVSADGQTINGGTTADGYFSIDNSGKISITAAGAASAVNVVKTGQTDHTYYLQAGDAQGNWSLAQQIVLNEVDSTAPIFSQATSYSFSYKETVDADTVVAEITTATDNVGVTQYRFVSTDGQTVIGSTTEDGFFSIDNSGKVSITYDGWDSEVAQFASGEGDQHTYYVQAGDAQGNWSVSQQITLTELDDKAPVFDYSYGFSYNENNVANDVVAHITSVSDNSGVVTQFRFVSNDGQTINGATTFDGYFSIDNSGKVSITATGAAATVSDIQTQTTHSYLLQAGDAQGNWSSSQTITLNAVDSTAPAFSQDADYSFSYRENQRVDGLVAEISNTVSDKVGVTQYRFVSFDGEVIHGDTSEDGYFSIDSSGKITMTAAGVGSAVNDFETLTDPSTDGLADFSFALPNFFQPIFFEPLPLEPTYYVQAGDAQGNWSSVQEITLSELDLFISVDGKGDAANPGRAWYDDNQDGVLDEGETSISKTVVDENYQKQNSIFNGTTSYTLDGVDFATDDIHIKAWQLDGGCLDLHGFTSDDRIELDLANMVDAYGQKTGNQAVLNVVGTVASNSQGLIKTLLVENLKAPTASRPAGTGSVYMVADWGQPTSGRAIGAIKAFNNEQNAVCVFGYNTSDVSTVVSQGQIIVSWPEFT